MGCCTSNQNTEDINILNVEYKDCKRFIPPITFGKVVKVYDGDTITIANYLHPLIEPRVFYKFNIRLRRIDSPEINSKDLEIKKKAIESRDILKDLIFNKIVKLENVGIDKYGRLLAEVLIDCSENTINVSDFMLNQNLAVKYDGGSKNK